MTITTTYTVPQPLSRKAGQLPTVDHSPTYPLPTASSFEAWLATDLGQEVYRRIMNNLHGVWMELSASYFDTAQDVQQKALIWLWQRWETDPGYTSLARDATNLSHAAGCITKVAVLAARCKYAKRRREGREKQTDLLADDGYQLPAAIQISPDSIRATDLHEHDRLGNGQDKRADVQDAIERVVARMIENWSISPGNYRRIPIEHITRTIIEGYISTFAKNR